MDTIFNFLMEHGYVIAVIFGIIWVALEIADYIRKKKRKAEINNVFDNLSAETSVEIDLQRKAYEMNEGFDDE